MKYCDLHCDALTNEGVLQVHGDFLRKSDCHLQCFACFVSKKERYAEAVSLCEKFYAFCKREGLFPVTSYKDLQKGRVNALLTVEDGGAIEGDLQKLKTLYFLGVRMMTLTWNTPNEIGFPNYSKEKSRFLRETERGLTEFGREVVEEMGRLGILVDVSHGSDKLFFEVAERSKRSKIPFIASHSGANSAYAHARNLTDRQIKTLSDCGGVVGLCFCADFLSGERSAEGQKEALLSHLRTILNAGGEDALALGSDFDGIPPNAYLPSAGELPEFFEEIKKEFGSSVLEKITHKNSLRVLQSVLK